VVAPGAVVRPGGFSTTNQIGRRGGRLRDHQESTRARSSGLSDLCRFTGPLSPSDPCIGMVLNAMRGDDRSVAIRQERANDRFAPPSRPFKATSDVP
jgi:hypothetical protein